MSGQLTSWRALIPTRASLENNRWLRPLTRWFGHPALWRWSRRGVALGVALGVFFGLLIPLAQIPAAAVAAIVLRANLPAAAASTLITNPITFGPIYYAAWHLGAFLTGEGDDPLAGEPHDRATSAQEDEEASFWQRVKALGKPLLVGLSTLAVVCGTLTYVIVSLIWRWRVLLRRRRQVRRQRSPAAEDAATVIDRGEARY